MPLPDLPRVPVAPLRRVLLAALALPCLASADVSSRPFLPPSPASTNTLFAALDSAQTGIVTTNAYEDPRMWRERYHEFGLGAIGTGVALADFDQDGLVDVFVVSKLETCRLFRNLGDWKFEDVTERSGLADLSSEWKQGAAFVDVDNDGWLDLYLCRFAAPNLLFMNQGDGTFKEEAAARGLAINDASGMANFEDYDRDGWLDVYIQTNLLAAAAAPEGQSDILLRNNGDGTFSDVTAKAGVANTSQGHSATWFDYDGDGWPDLYVANDFAEPDYLYSNQRDGTFRNVLGSVVPHTPYSSMGADIGDVDNDGLIDLLVTDMAMTSHEMDQRGMADSRARTTETTPGQPDQAIQLGRNTLFLNTGLARYLDTAYLAGIAATDWTWSVRFEDLDNDGFVDLHVTNGMNREQNNVDLITAIQRSETAQARVRRMIAAPILAQANLAYRNRGDGTFEPSGPAWGLDHLGVSFGAAFADLDNDGDLDLVYTNYQSGVSVFRNESQSGNRVAISLRGATSNRFGVGATIRLETASGPQVRRLTQARGYLSTSEPAAHFGLGPHDRIERLTIEWPSGITQTLADLPANHHHTLSEPSPEPPSPTPAPSPTPQFIDVSAATGLGLAAPEERLEGTVSQPLLATRFNRRGPGLAIADLDGDRIDEIVLGGTTLQPARVLARQANGSYQPDPRHAGLPPGPVNDGPPLVFPFANSPQPALLLPAGGAVFHGEDPEYAPRLFLQNASNQLRPAPPNSLPELSLSAGAAVAADFDRDGNLDLFLGARVLPGYFPETPVSALLAQHDGRLVDLTDEIAPELREIGMVAAALWTDIDRDGWPDLLLALDWGGVRYFRNLEGKSFADRSEQAGFAAAGHGWWTSIATADFNNDGAPDFAIGNLGLNTQFQPTPESPELLYYHDFAKTGAPQLVAAYYENGRLLPRATRRELAAKIPEIAKRYPRNDDFAKATLPEILGPEALARAPHLHVAEPRSGLFLSQPNGPYRFVPLPAAAQAAPIQGLVAADFDGDGHLDLVAAHNSYAPAPAVGRFDGGLGCWLRGDGQGNFHPVPHRHSGFAIPGDAKALGLLDLDSDGWPDLLATRNNAPAIAFRNAGHPHRRPLAVRLRGPATNPAAIGARIGLQSPDGTIQWQTLHSGSSYATQSTPTAFFSLPPATPTAQSTPPHTLHIHWPNAQHTTHPLPQNPPPTLTIPHP